MLTKRVCLIPPPPPDSVTFRFTLDGSDQLEANLADLCQAILGAVKGIVPRRRLDALVLAGGYGRGEGGVLRFPESDKPYNDIEFYAFVTGNPLLNEHRYRKPLDEVGRNLSPGSGLHIEFKVESISKLRAGPVSMFSYDLVSAHRLIGGRTDIFEGCERHLDPANIPPIEGTRLLLNRGTGLLLAREMLDADAERLTNEQADFVGRNLAKAKLALGDALLASLHLYHWSCRERHARLLVLREQYFSNRSTLPPLELLDQILLHHTAGMEFKLHPKRISKSVSKFIQEHSELTALACEVWLWLESRRLEQPFASLEDYALRRCPSDLAGPAWRNYALNAKTFGLSALFDPLSRRYPRERLLSSLPLLLRRTDISREPAVRAHLQKQLRTRASNWAGLVSAYKHVWSGYA